MKMAHSFSRMDCFEKCKYKYKLKYIDKVPGEVPNILLVGSAIHEVIAEYFRTCITLGVPEVFERWKEITTSVLARLNTPRECHDEIYAAVKGYVESKEVPLDNIYGVEQEFALNRKLEKCEWDDKDVYIRSIIDLLQINGNVGRITDYKTGYRLNVDIFQQKIYALVLSKIFTNLTEFEILLDYTRYDLVHGPYLVGKEELIDFEEKLIRKLDAIEKEEKFEAQINITCDYCEYASMCPLIKKLENNYVFPNNKGEAERLGEQYIALGVAQGKIKDLLEKYCDAVGDMVAGGKKFCYKASEGYGKINVSKLLIDCAGEGIAIGHCLNFDSRKAKGLMADEKFLKLLGENSQKEIKVSFSVAKDKGE